MKEEIGKPNDLVPLALLRAMDQFYGIEYQGEPEMLYSFCAEGKSSPKRKKPLRILYATFLRYPNVGGLASYITSIKTGLSASVIRRMSSRRSKCRHLFFRKISRGPLTRSERFLLADTAPQTKSL